MSTSPHPCAPSRLDRFVKRGFAVILLCVALGDLSPGARACSCAWRGPFLKVAPDAPLIVRGKILRHNPGRAPSMDVLVLEMLTGGVLDSGLRVQMSDGAACRPEVSQFPVGSEWVLALNGPGAKPGDSLALSHCGAFWLRVEGEQVIGEIDGPQGQSQRRPLAELRRLLRPPQRMSFRGKVARGKVFRKPIGGGLTLCLEPSKQGFLLTVHEAGREEDLSRLTPPLHSAPNPREIEGWQLRDPIPPGCVPPYGATAGPQSPREFVFSPEVGRAIAGPASKEAPTPADLERVGRFGRGKLWLENVKVSMDRTDPCPILDEVEFRVELETR
jgi:hypothetical protein